MLLLSVAGLASLLALNFAVSRSFLFPPSLFTGMWLLSLLTLLVLGDLFFPPSDTACLIYMFGGLSFSLGGLLVLRDRSERAHKPLPQIHDSNRKWIHRCLDLVLIILIAGFPYYLHIAQQLAGDSNFRLMLAAIRSQELDAQSGVDPFGIIGGNLALLALLCAPAMFYESTGTWAWRARSVAAVLLVLAYGLLSGSKESVLIIFVLFFVSWIKFGVLRVRTLALATGVVAALFSAGTWLVNFASTSAGESGAMARKIGFTVLQYWLGGVVAFGRVADDPESIRVSQNIWRFFLETARKFGAEVTVPILHAPYTVIYSDTMGKTFDTNVYTIYFSYYPDFGWAGVVIGMFFTGATTTLVWNRAKRGDPVCSLIYASLCVGIVMSVFAEHFFLILNFYIKAIVFYLGLYVLVPNAARAFRAIYAPSSGTQSEIA